MTHCNMTHILNAAVRHTYITYSYHYFKGRGTEYYLYIEKFSRLKIHNLQAWVHQLSINYI